MVDGQNLSDNSLHASLSMVRKFSTLEPLLMAFLAGPGPSLPIQSSAFMGVLSSDYLS